MKQKRIYNFPGSPGFTGPVLFLFFLVCGLNSCENNPVDAGIEEFSLEEGVFILCEGQFLSANASVSFFSPPTDSVSNHIFQRANQAPIGDVLSSMTTDGDNAYFVVNNSGKIYRTGTADLVFRGKIGGLISPRFMVIDEDRKGYVSDLYSGYIMVLDPEEAEVLDSIKISNNAVHRPSGEQMIWRDGKLYVACWSYGQEVLVIDTESRSIIDSIQVGKQPNSMVVDRHGDLWVLSDGGYPMSPFGQEEASLSRINLISNQSERMYTWSDIRASPADLCINNTGDSLYLIGEGIYKVSLDMQGFENALIPENDRQFYSLGIDPGDGTVYVADAVDYQQDGWVYRYTAAGSLIDSFRVGVNPGYFYFSGTEQQ